MKPEYPIDVDILALDAEDTPVLAVEVAHRGEADAAVRARLEAALRAARSEIPFGMLVNRDAIMVYRWNGQSLSEPVEKGRTETVLSAYEPELSSQEIYDDYFRGLIVAWLRDLAYHWKSEAPPYGPELTNLGLTQRLADGSVFSDVVLAA